MSNDQRSNNIKVKVIIYNSFYVILRLIKLLKIFDLSK